MAGPASIGPWKGLFDWSMQYQDGTRAADVTASKTDPEKVKWLEGVLKNYMVDFTERMQAIQAGLEETANAPDATEEQVAVAEKHLEELMDIVESIDFARDLRSIGGLPVLKALMRSPHPSLRWRAADVVATCAQNNPPVQEWFHDEGVLPLAHELLGDEHPRCRLKGLLAVSCQIRGHAPSLVTFCQQLQGVPRVAALIADESPCVARKALELLRSLCGPAPTLRGALAATAPLQANLAQVLQGGDEGVQSSALALLADLADSQDAVRCLRESTEVKEAFRAADGAVRARARADTEAYEEELAWLDAAEAAIGFLDAAEAPP